MKVDVGRTLDTVAVLRVLGPGAVARAAARRVGSRARAIYRDRLVLPDAPTPRAVVRMAYALRCAPSPFVEEDDELKFHTLERERSGARRQVLERAYEAAAGLDHELGRALHSDAGDPRLAQEPARLARLVRVALGVRAAATTAEATALRRVVERGALAWLEANPAAAAARDPFCTPLELGLRAWNLWVAVAAAGAPQLQEPAAAGIARALWEHGRALDIGLEDAGLVVGSHLVGELLGLLACGTALRLDGWRRLATARLRREARRQVLADGGGAEGSTGYARFVAELWLGALLAARAGGEPPPPELVAASAAMLRGLSGAMTPDGRDPGVGDDDGSHVLPPLARDAADVGALLPLLPALLGERERLEGIPWSEEAAWATGVEGYKRFRAAPTRRWPVAWSAPAFGLYVARRGGRGGDMVAVRAGPHGQGGAGGHAHNDPLAVTVWLAGRPVVVDSGTGIYVGRRAWRDRFRGVAAHATLCVDGEEPSPIPPTRPFALPDVAGARVLEREERERGWRCVASHRGYARLGVSHRREVRFDRDARVVTIIDYVQGAGEHTLALSFPLGLPEAEVVPGAIRVGAAGAPRAWLVADDGPADLRWRLDAAPLSPKYGELVPGLVARRIGRVRLPAVLSTRITPEK